MKNLFSLTEANTIQQRMLMKKKKMVLLIENLWKAKNLNSDFKKKVKKSLMKLKYC